MALKLYALGHKQWVEVRRGRVKPTLSVSTRKHTLNLNEDERQEWLDDHYTNPPRTTTLKQIVIKGGKFLTSMKTRRFKSVTGLSIKQGQVVELSSSLAATVLKGLNGQPSPTEATS